MADLESLESIHAPSYFHAGAYAEQRTKPASTPVDDPTDPIDQRLARARCPFSGALDS